MYPRLVFAGDTGDLVKLNVLPHHNLILGFMFYLYVFVYVYLYEIYSIKYYFPLFIKQVFFTCIKCIYKVRVRLLCRGVTKFTPYTYRWMKVCNVIPFTSSLLLTEMSPIRTVGDGSLHSPIVGVISCTPIIHRNYTTLNLPWIKTQKKRLLCIIKNWSLHFSRLFKDIPL